MANKNRSLYLAYGSNLSVEQMAQRCPDATIVGTAMIPGYRLMYKGSQTGSYASVEPEEGYQVPVLVWEISHRDEARLDRYEGFPTFYHKKYMDIEITSLDGKATISGKDAMVYIMDEKRKYGAPDPYYEGILRDGYREFGFDEKILDEALGYSIGQIYRFKRSRGYAWW